MSDIALRTVGLGKMYRIGGERARYRTLRDTLVQTARRPIERMRHPGAATHSSQELWALRDVDLEVKQGEVLGIIGRNGAGKSTLLKVLSHITEPTEGRVEITGRVGSLLEVGTGFHPELTGRENIQLNGAILGMSRKEITRKFDEIVAFAEIEKFLDTPVKRYSSGMYVRLAFAVAAHLEPEILVVDEVLAVGDAAFQQKCLGKMHDVAGHGRTVLFVSHNMAAVHGLCSQCAYLKDGRVANMGPVGTIVNEYLAGLQSANPRYQADVSAIAADVAILAVSLPDTSDNSAFRFADDLRCQVTYLVRRRVADLHINLKFRNDQSISVLYASSRDYAIGRNVEFTEPGKYAAYVTIPGHLLFPGRYFLDVEAEIHKVKMFDVIQSCISFEIVSWGDIDVYGGGFGLTYPNLKWTIESLDA